MDTDPADGATADGADTTLATDPDMITAPQAPAASPESPADTAAPPAMITIPDTDMDTDTGADPPPGPADGMPPPGADLLQARPAIPLVNLASPALDRLDQDLARASPESLAPVLPKALQAPTTDPATEAGYLDMEDGGTADGDMARTTPAGPPAPPPASLASPRAAPSPEREARALLLRARPMDTSPGSEDGLAPPCGNLVLPAAAAPAARAESLDPDHQDLDRASLARAGETRHRQRRLMITVDGSEMDTAGITKSPAFLKSFLGFQDLLLMTQIMTVNL
jgi:hypothetical protein